MYFYIFREFYYHIVKDRSALHFMRSMFLTNTTNMNLKTMQWDKTEYGDKKLILVTS